MAKKIIFIIFIRSLWIIIIKERNKQKISCFLFPFKSYRFHLFNRYYSVFFFVFFLNQHYQLFEHFLNFSLCIDEHNKPIIKITFLKTTFLLLCYFSFYKLLEFYIYIYICMYYIYIYIQNNLRYYY